MTRLPILSGSDLVKILSKAGFQFVRQKGSHIILVKFTESKKRAVVVPNHKEIDRGTLSEIIRQAGLTKDEFLKLV